MYVYPQPCTDTVSKLTNNYVNSRASQRVEIIHFLPVTVQLVYVSVRGVQAENVFSIIIWDMIFEEDTLTVHVRDDATPSTEILDLTDHLKMTNVT